MNRNNIITVCRYIVGVDINDSKFAAAVSMGATECVNSMTCEGGDVKSWLLARKTSFFFNISLVKGSAVDISSDLPFKDGHV